VIKAVSDFLARYKIRRFRAVIATALLGVWVTACIILVYAHLTIPNMTSTSAGTSVTLQSPDSSYAQSILKNKRHIRELSANLSISLRDGDCLRKSAIMTAELRLSKDDPLFTPLETGQLQSTTVSQALGNV
jgi:hypothetical protein